ncbi:hypothetical protein BC30048_2929 [Bacillus cereus]|nr:hypothetical protein BC30048_2929 [Bacillus cereus]
MVCCKSKDKKSEQDAIIKFNKEKYSNNRVKTSITFLPYSLIEVFFIAKSIIYENEKNGEISPFL